MLKVFYFVFFFCLTHGAVLPTTTLVRTPQLDSVVVESSRVGPSFAYETVETKAYTPVAISYLTPLGYYDPFGTTIIGGQPFYPQIQYPLIPQIPGFDIQQIPGYPQIPIAPQNPILPPSAEVPPGATVDDDTVKVETV